ncbi:beta strand repeat-containing protein [Solimonas marina]|uniref:Uncharacterized protein n=1 Tax=Solimonas marina TaxID=2714601 RepID=A0A969W802_9GAMM|nr:hypothetical protein [Solimonas marina]NKF21169.1 hypothetical protein [Solimonas marina]
MLTVLLVGLAITVTTLGVMWEIRGTQDKTLAVHTATLVQSRAWSGVELLRDYLATLDTTTLDSLPSALTVGGESGVAISGLSVSGSGTTYTVTANITGSGADSTSTVRAVYSVTPASTGSSTASCASTTPAAAMVFNGDLTYSGGSLVVTDSADDFTNVAVAGDITVGSGASAKISGCASGDISLSGGGIETGATLKAGGTITVNSMSAPSSATMWAKNIVYGNTGSGTFTAMEAGAYTADVYSGSAKIGTTNVGGSIIASTAGSDIPWTTGTIVPQASDSIVITLDDGSGSFLLPMSDVSIDSSTGAVSGASAAELLSGSGSLPDNLSFVATGIDGGNISLYVQTITTLWGHTLTIQGYGGTYTNLLSNGNLKIVTGTISNLVGGGYLWATSAGASGSSTWNFPTVTSGKIAGTIYYSSAQTALATGTAVSGMNVSRSQTGTSPGLPGIPYCDTRVDSVDAASLESSANYVFYFDSTTSHPMLRIQNVKTADGTAVDAGPYDLTTADVRTIDGKDFMQCNWYDSYCLRSATPSSGWTLTGVYKFPPGVAWFDGPVTVNGVNSGTQANLYDSLIATGDVDLTSSGHVPLYAPNYATASEICGGDFYPSDLCDMSGTEPAFVTWTASDGTTYTGLPIGNVAILTDGALSSSGWEIHGNVIIGGTVDTGGATTTIYGTVTVGANGTSTTTVSQGGIKVVTDGLSSSQTQLPSSDCTTSSTPTAGSATTVWTRYL